MVVAERINPQCDTWHFWERRFRDAKDKDPRGAAEILTFMVLGNRNPERLREATGLYQDLARAQPGSAPPPPPEIRDRIDKAQFEQLVADAEQAVKNGRYEEARTKLDAAHERFTAQWSNDEKAQKVLEDVRFGVAFDKARNALEGSNLDAAQSKVKEALDIRPEDENARNYGTRFRTHSTRRAPHGIRRRSDNIDGTPNRRLPPKTFAARLTKSLKPMQFWKSHPMLRGLAPIALPWVRWRSPLR